MRNALTICFLFLTSLLVAQPGDPGGDPDVPLGGIEILIVAGALLGIKKNVGYKKCQR